MLARGENTAQKSPWPPGDSNLKPSCCEATVLATNMLFQRKVLLINTMTPDTDFTCSHAVCMNIGILCM